METKPLDWNSLVLAKFEALGQELRNLATGVTQLTVESENILRMLSRVELSIEKLEARDNSLQQAIDGLILGQHRTDAAVTLVSTDLRAALLAAATEARTAAQAVQAHERQIQGLCDSYMQINRRALDVEKDAAALGAEMKTKEQRLEAKIDATELRADAHRREWEPWAKAARWVVIGILTIAVGALAIWFLKDVAISIVNGGVP